MYWAGQLSLSGRAWQRGGTGDLQAKRNLSFADASIWDPTYGPRRLSGEESQCGRLCDVRAAASVSSRRRGQEAAGEDTQQGAWRRLRSPAATQRADTLGSAHSLGAVGSRLRAVLDL